MAPSYVKDNGANRPAHLVGAIEAPTALDAMTVALNYLGGDLPLLPDGETPSEQFPERNLWIQPEFRAVVTMPGVQTRNGEAGWRHYRDLPWCEPLRALTPDDFAGAVILQAAFELTYPVFRRVRTDWRLPDLSFQMGVPSPLDLSVLTFHEAGFSPELVAAISEAKARQVRACWAQAAGDVVFQIESPVAVQLVASAADPEEAASSAAAALTDLPGRGPDGCRWGIHLCDGDFHHEPMVRPATAEPLVLLANAIAARWPSGLEYVHLPFAAAGEPPALDASWYKPLSHLALPPDCRLAAGLVHEALDAGVLRSLYAMVEDTYGAGVTVAATCGLGRRPVRSQVGDALGKMAALVSRN